MPSFKNVHQKSVSLLGIFTSSSDIACFDGEEIGSSLLSGTGAMYEGRLLYGIFFSVLGSFIMCNVNHMKVTIVTMVCKLSPYWRNYNWHALSCSTCSSKVDRQLPQDT